MFEKYFQSPLTALYIFIIFIILSLVVASLYNSYDNYNSGKIYVLVSIITIFFAAAIIYLYYIIASLQITYKNSIVIGNNLDVLKREFFDLNPSIQSLTTVIPRFIDSITPLKTKKYEIPSDENNINQVMYEYLLSIKIFVTWREFLFTDYTDNPNSFSFIVFSLQLANSQQLYNYWKQYNIVFHANLKTLGDLLFKYALPITVQTNESYVKAAKELTAEKVYKELKISPK